MSTKFSMFKTNYCIFKEFTTHSKIQRIYYTSLLQVKSYLQLKHAQRFSRNNFLGRSENNTNWSTIIWNQLARVLRTHAFKVDIEHMFNTASSELNPNSNIVQSESQRKLYETIESKDSLQLIL